MSFEATLITRLLSLAQQGQRPVVGLNGPVGAGKSTLAAALGPAGRRPGPAPGRGLHR